MAARPAASPAAAAAARAARAQSRRARRPWYAAAGVALGALVYFLAQAAVARPEFDKDLAWTHLEKQVAFGPRVPNMEGHRSCSRYMAETLRPLADSVEMQRFNRKLDGKTLRMVNVVARWKGKRVKGAENVEAEARSKGVLLCAHWDTRPTADYENTPERRRQPIPGANDGASGVAVLLEIARLFKHSPPPVPVMMVFFDGEDYGPGLDRMFLGSRYFANNLPRDVPRQGILLDMVGDRDLQIPMEANSRRAAPQVLDSVYDVARELGLDRYFPRQNGGEITDDHVILHDKGLKVIDLIDFTYGPWHTLADTPDKCSATSLKVVGDVVTEWTYRRR